MYVFQKFQNFTFISWFNVSLIASWILDTANSVQNGQGPTESQICFKLNYFG